MPSSHRYQAVDALRGVIMMLMAVDHASAFIARQHASEFWSGAMSAYSAAFPFLTRLVTHLCAPGFFFLMGAGAYWFAASRRAAGWTEVAIARRLAWRGLVMVGVAQLVEGPLPFLQDLLKPAAVRLNRITAPPPIDGSSFAWALVVLTGLGLVLTICAVLVVWARPWMWLAVSALCLLLTNSALPADGKPGPLWHALLLAPGLSQHVMVVYPVIPWLAGAAAGMYFAHRWRLAAAAAPRWVAQTGAALLVTGLALRAAGGWGNLRSPRDAGWIEFFNNVKYPPSAVFWALSLGVNLLILAVLLRWTHALPRPLVVFGQTPLFFYAAHLYLLFAAGYFFFPEAGSLAQAWLVWAVALACLYPLCRAFQRFKQAMPAESWWRLF
ncbi:MAG: DUF1624 domain-containing protein [Bryobacterales bacterium]|nr:DUF1624 domain-containing protein [Bryobacterales bacterium]